MEDEEEKEGRRGELNFSPPFEQGGGRKRRKRPWADLAVGTRRRRRAHEKDEVKKSYPPFGLCVIISGM